MLTFLGDVCWAGLNIAIFNIPFAFAPEKGRTLYLGFYTVAAGVSGVIFSLLGSILVGAFGNLSWSFFGLSVVGIQLLFLVSAALLGCCLVYLYKAFGRQPFQRGKS